MRLIATKDISPQLPAGSVFEQADATHGRQLIAMGVAREASEVDAETPSASVSRRRYRTRALQAED